MCTTMAIHPDHPRLRVEVVVDDEPLREYDDAENASARDTNLIAKYVEGKPKVQELDALQPGSDLELLLDWSRAQTGADICWVGHSPDVEYLTAGLIGDTAARIRFAKGAVAAIEIDSDVVAGDGQA